MSISQRQIGAYTSKRKKKLVWKGGTKTMLNLEQLTKQLENLEQEKRNKYKEYTQKIQELQAMRIKNDQEYEQEIESVKFLILEQLGDQEEIETESFIVSKQHPDLTKPSYYKLQLPKEAEQKERFIDYMKKEHPELLKEKTAYSPVQLDIKKLVADQVFHLTDENQVVDENGQLIPYLSADVKGIEPKVKVKK